MSYMPCPASSPFVIIDEDYRLRCNCLQPPVTSFFLGPYILLSTLFSNTISVYKTVNTILLFVAVG
jgi:hypothetical protein